MLWRDRCTTYFDVDVDYIEDDKSLEMFAKLRLDEVRGKGKPIQYIWILNTTHKFNKKSKEAVVHLVKEMKRLGKSHLYINIPLELDSKEFSDVLFRLNDNEVKEIISELNL
ncbi:hypothetical protein UT300012_24590 [Paraclostridium bifermentans]